MLNPKQFNQAVAGDGIGFKTTEAKEMLRIPMRAEAHHIELMGDTGAGKTTLMMQILRQVQARGHAAIVYDPAGEYIQRFYDERRKDVVLNPLDARCPYWGPSEELRTKAEAKTLAKSLYQPTPTLKDEFFTETPQKIFAHLLQSGPTPRHLVEWMANPAEIDKRVRGTEMATMIAKGSPHQRNGVSPLSALSPTACGCSRPRGTRERTWARPNGPKPRKGWIFITSSPASAMPFVHCIASGSTCSSSAPQVLRRAIRSGLVRARRTGDFAEASAAAYRHHREPQEQEPYRPWLSGQGAVGGHLRASRGGDVVAAGNQNLSQDHRTEGGAVGERAPSAK